MENGMKDLFDIASAGEMDFSSQYEETQPYMGLKHMDQVLVAVASIEPRKEEVDVLPPDRAAKAALHVGWERGIVLKVLPVKIRRWKKGNGTEDDVLEEILLFDPASEPSNLKINFVCYPLYEKLSERDITSGYTRVISPDETHKTLKITGFPPNWSNMPPVGKFQFWWDVISKKFGARGKLNVGDAFWAYVNVRDLTHEKDDEGNQKYKKPFTNLTKSIKDPVTESWLESKYDIEQIPSGLINEVLSKIEKPSNPDEKVPF